MSNDGWLSQYDDFITEAEKDDRVGDHDAVVTEVRAETWPSGDPRYKVYLTLTSAGNAKVDATMSERPTAAELEGIKATADRGKKKAVALNLNLHKALREYYSVSHPSKLSAGTSVRVKCVKNKDGFIRVIAFLPKGGASATTSDVPF